MWLTLRMCFISKINRVNWKRFKCFQCTCTHTRSLTYANMSFTQFECKAALQFLQLCINHHIILQLGAIQIECSLFCRLLPVKYSSVLNQRVTLVKSVCASSYTNLRHESDNFHKCILSLFLLNWIFTRQRWSNNMSEVIC